MKKFISALLICMMIFPLTVNCSSEVVVEASNNPEPTGLIYALGIAPEGQDLSGSVTRGEFAYLMTSLLNFNVPDYTDEQLFYDVDKNNPYIAAVNMIYKTGYMSGDGNGHFRPDDEITYNEVIASLVNALDYGISNYTGIEYPWYHLKRAEELEISVPVSGQVITRGEVYVVIELALEAPCRGVNGIWEENYILGAPDTTILEQMYDIYYDEGIVTANYRTSLYSDAALDDAGRIEIDNKTYFTTDSSIANRLGEKIKFYYKADGKNSTVMFFTDSADCKTVDVCFDEIDVYNSGTLEYTPNGSYRTKEAKISERANVIYNGTYCKKGYELKSEDFDINAGSVKLIANDDNVFDTIRIEDFTFGIFGRISGEGDKIYMNTDNSVYQLDDYESVIFIKDGVEIDPATIAEGEVFNILEDKQKKYMTVYVTSDVVEGTLNQSVTAEDGSTYIIDNTAYKLNHRFDALNTKEAKPGRSNVFLLDMFGNIIAVQAETANVGKYGVLLGIAQGNLDEIAFVKFLNSKNKIKIFEITSKTAVNGVKYKDRDSFKWFIENSDALKGKLVTFENNVDGDLTKLCIESVDGYENEFSKEIENQRLRYKSGSQLFGDAKVGVRDNTAIFIVSSTVTSDDDCECIPRTYLDGDSFYYISAYNYNEYNVADIIVVHEDASSYTVDQESAVFVLESIRSALDKDGNEVYKLIGETDGAESVGHYWFEQGSENIDVNLLNPGNVLMVKASSKGKVLAVDCLYEYNPDNIDLYYESSSVLLGKILARVVGISGDMCLVNVADEGEDLRILKPAGTVYVYDNHTKEFRVGTSDDIFPDSLIFVRERYQTIREIVVYNK